MGNGHEPRWNPARTDAQIAFFPTKVPFGSFDPANLVIRRYKGQTQRLASNLSDLYYCKIYLMMPIVTKRSREDVPHVPQHFKPESNRIPSWWWGGSPVSLDLPLSKGCDSSRGPDIMHGKYSVYSAIMSICHLFGERFDFSLFHVLAHNPTRITRLSIQIRYCTWSRNCLKTQLFYDFFVCILQLPQQCDFDTRCGRGKCEKQDWRHTSKVHRLGI